MGVFGTMVAGVGMGFSQQLGHGDLLWNGQRRRHGELRVCFGMIPLPGVMRQCRCRAHEDAIECAQEITLRLPGILGN